MNDDIAIKIEGLTKIYKIFDRPIDRVKEALNPFHKRYSRDFYALNDVSFEIKKGETVGIIGKNGAGKSTLLKIITGVLTPTSGSVEVNGRIASLLELGAGFNPEMTGIENIYMNGSVMGYDKKEMDDKIDAIIDFADIGDFIYQPVKMYSSGMFARLAFAMNSTLEPDVLIVDEALAVGDMAFQNKCFRRMKALQESQTTLLFVSHDISSVKLLCQKCLWLAEGKAKAYGDVNEIADAYFQEQLVAFNEYTDQSGGPSSSDEKIAVNYSNELIKLPLLRNVKGLKSDIVEIKSFFFEENGKRVSRLQAGHTYEARMAARFSTAETDLIFGFMMENRQGVALIGINSFIATEEKTINIVSNGIVEVGFKFMLPKIMRGKYLISLAVAKGAQSCHKQLAWLDSACEIEIDNDGYNLSLIEIDCQTSVKNYAAEQVSFY